MGPLAAQWGLSQKELCKVLLQAQEAGEAGAVTCTCIEELVSLHSPSALHVRDLVRLLQGGLPGAAKGANWLIHYVLFYLVKGTEHGLPHPSTQDRGYDNALTKALTVRHAL